MGHRTRPGPDARVLVIGLGNPILGDDGVGWKIAEDVASRVNSREGIEVDCLALGGLGLMERMLGYDHVILIDSMETGRFPEGTVSSVTLDELQSPDLGHSASAHDASLPTALETARLMGAQTPRLVDIVAVETKSELVFSEQLSPGIALAVPVAAQRVMELLPAG